MHTENSLFALLSNLLLTPEDQNPAAAGGKSADVESGSTDFELLSLSQSELTDVAELATRHHVVMRAFRRLYALMVRHRRLDQTLNVMNIMADERRRIDRALSVLNRICRRFEAEGCHVVVIKSLDHWPDLGSDLDLYTSARPEDMMRIMAQGFNARPTERSWGDRLANKWNFALPELPELVEFHVGRLGQTGEQVATVQGLRDRAACRQIDHYRFLVPSSEDRVIISTLQRMYRHFYFRLCDIVDAVQLLECHAIDYETLRASAEAGGVWEGTATYLAVVAGWVKAFGHEEIPLPAFVRAAARFGSDQVSFAKGYLRVPIVPQSLRLFASELRQMVAQGNLRASARLTLFPALAAAAALGYKLSGSDKGIW